MGGIEPFVVRSRRVQQAWAVLFHLVSAAVQIEGNSGEENSAEFRVRFPISVDLHELGSTQMAVAASWAKAALPYTCAHHTLCTSDSLMPGQHSVAVRGNINKDLKQKDYGSSIPQLKWLA